MTFTRTTIQTLPITLRQAFYCQCRHINTGPSRVAPRPTAFVPDLETFLTLIGRGMSKHASKIPSWDALFNSTSEELEIAGLDPPNERRYLLWWREKYRTGNLGIGGDLRNVTNGVALLKVGRLASSEQPDGYRPVIINPRLSAEDAERLSALPGEGIPDNKETVTETEKLLSKAQPVVQAIEKESFHGLRIAGKGAASHVTGRGIRRLRGGVTLLQVREGLWEQRPGKKPDGGERRRAEVRAKRFAEERRKAR